MVDNNSTAKADEYMQRGEKKLKGTKKVVIKRRFFEELIRK
jgi:hypothetical protein